MLVTFNQLVPNKKQNGSINQDGAKLFKFGPTLRFSHTPAIQNLKSSEDKPH